MSVSPVEFNKVMAILNMVAVGLLAWMGAQFGELPRKVTILETKEVIQSQRLERMDGKLDMILAKLPRP